MRQLLSLLGTAHGLHKLWGPICVGGENVEHGSHCRFRANFSKYPRARDKHLNCHYRRIVKILHNLIDTDLSAQIEVLFRR
jgi:hypothetical protein